MDGCAQAKYRSRFFQLADVFLSSNLVPAYTMAAFAKKFSRLALTAPPAGANPSPPPLLPFPLPETRFPFNTQYIVTGWT